ncbi:MAG: class I SAM-dependent methyltransferase, partial [Gammaproteobacteria bacterium]
QSVPFGQHFFTLMSHTLYDVGLYKFVNPFIWRCPTERLLALYRDNTSKNHLEIGIGTGCLLSSTLTAPPQRLALMDLNAACLRKSARRLARFAPTIYQHNILEPFTESIARFDSIGNNYVLHCVCGSFREKGKAFDHIGALLADGGTYFGSTVLTHGVANPLQAKAMIWALNACDVFHSLEDSLVELESALRAAFSSVDLKVYGSSAVFKAVK